MRTLHLAHQTPYEWDAILRFLQARAIPCVELVARGRYLRTIVVQQRGERVHGVIAVERDSEAALKLTVHGASRASLPAIAERVRRVFDLDADPSSIATHLARDPALAPFVEKHPGHMAVRALSEPDAFLAADVGLHRALARPDGVRPTPKEMLALAEAWRPYRAYATLHLWTSLNQTSPKPAPAKAAGKKRR